MVAMPVYGPMCEDDVRALSEQDATEFLVVLSIHNRTAVVLACKCWPCFQRATSVLRFGGSDISTAIERRSPTKALTTIQIQQNHFVSEVSVAGDGPSTAAFGVARMAARNDNLGRFEE